MEKGFKISSIYAFITTDIDGTEGIVGQYISDGWMPLICADEANVERLKPVVKNISNMSEYPIKLVKFSTRECLEEY